MEFITEKRKFASLTILYALTRSLQLSTFYNTVVCIFIIYVTKIVECTISSEQNVSKTLISLARRRRVKYGRFWLLSGRREVGAEIREFPENTGDLATLLMPSVLVRHWWLR